MTTKLEPTDALRETAECLLLTQREMASDVADMAAAVVSASEASERLLAALGVIDELKRAVEQVGEALPFLTRKLGELFDQQQETQAQLGRYIQDAAKQSSGIRQVEARLRLLEGGRSEQR